MNRLEGKTALVTGAASGIGQATAIRLAAEGASLFCVDLQEEGLAETHKLIEEAGGVAETFPCDVSDENSVIACVDACIQRFGKLDHVSNLAGILRFDRFHDSSLADFEQVMRVNVNGVYLVCREAIPQLLQTRGNIVNAASTSALAGLPWGGAYSASKGAVLAMTRSLAIEYSSEGLRVNCVCPGDVTTPMSRTALPEGVDLKLMGRCMSPTGRRGPEVVAAVIAMLASEDGAHITGEDIRMDGGTLS